MSPSSGELVQAPSHPVPFCFESQKKTKPQCPKSLSKPLLPPAPVDWSKLLLIPSPFCRDSQHKTVPQRPESLGELRIPPALVDWAMLLLIPSPFCLDSQKKFVSQYPEHDAFFEVFNHTQGFHNASFK